MCNDVKKRTFLIGYPLLCMLFLKMSENGMACHKNCIFHGNGFNLFGILSAKKEARIDIRNKTVAFTICLSLGELTITLTDNDVTWRSDVISNV